ncbi:MAG TPA: cytochrome P450 [Cytophagaceae bacterium]
MTQIPKENPFTSAIALFREGYNFIQNRCAKNKSDLFQISFPGMQIICMTGAEAAKIFYDPQKFVRKGAIPVRVQKTLLGTRVIHTQDGEAHKKRKQMFMSMMTETNIKHLATLVGDHMEKYALQWTSAPSVVLFDEVRKILTAAVCEWAGVPLKEGEVKARADDFIAMVDAFGAMGPRFWRGKLARKRTEKWIMTLIEKVKRGEMIVKGGSPLEAVLDFRNIDGKPFDAHLAAVELINFLRPTVAISYYIVFAAHALQKYPQYKELLATGDDVLMEQFINEVRRYYPIGPFIGARVKENFEWNGYPFRKGAMVLLDIYGTNHDARYWPKPQEFSLENFQNWDKSPFDFIPQGGGGYYSGHRCPGEWITIDVMKVFLNYLAKNLSFEMPAQDTEYDLRRMPTYPKSGIVISNVVYHKAETVGQY